MINVERGFCASGAKLRAIKVKFGEIQLIAKIAVVKKHA